MSPVSRFAVLLTALHTVISAAAAPPALWDLGAPVPWDLRVVQDVNKLGTPELWKTDVRVRDALAHWEEKTCARFQLHEGVHEPEPHIVFVLGTAETCVSVHNGRAAGEAANVILLSPQCTTGGLIREVGRALGMPYQHCRPDRDQYITVHADKADSSARHLFDVEPWYPTAYPYDYGSIMHFGQFTYALTAEDRVIEAVVPVGQTYYLSGNDVSMFDFLYNGCPAVGAPAPAPMTCHGHFQMAEQVSLQESGGAADDIHLPHSVPSVLEVHAAAGTAPADVAATFTVEAADGKGAVTLEGIAAPVTLLQHSIRGADVNGTDDTLFHYKFAVTFTPPQALAGRRLTVTHSIVSDGKTEAACRTSKTVVVHSESTRCVDECQGTAEIGVCTGVGLDRCVCKPPHGGFACQATPSCPHNYITDFHTGDVGMWDVRHGAVRKAPAAGGAAAATSLDPLQRGGLVIGHPEDPMVSLKLYGSIYNPIRQKIPRAAELRFTDNTYKPVRITYFAARPADARVFAIFHGGAEHSACIAAYHTEDTDECEGQYCFFDIRVDWAAKTYAMYQNHKLRFSAKPFVNQTAGACEGFSGLELFGDGHFDSFHVWCHDYFDVAGTLFDDKIGQTQLQLGGHAARLSLHTASAADPAAAGSNRLLSLKSSVPLDGALQAAPATSPFNALKPLLLADGSGSRLQTTPLQIDLGPLAAVKAYRSRHNAFVYLNLFNKVAATGDAAPQVSANASAPTPFDALVARPGAENRRKRAEVAKMSPEELGFLVRGYCNQGYHNTFDVVRGVEAAVDAASIDTEEKLFGAGSLHILRKDYQFTFDVTLSMPDYIRVYVRPSSAQPRLALMFGSGDSKLRAEIGFDDSGSVRINNVELDASYHMKKDVWYAVSFTFDWGEYDETADKASFRLVIGETAEGVPPNRGLPTQYAAGAQVTTFQRLTFEEFKYQTGVERVQIEVDAGTHVDELEVSCGEVAATQAPAPLEEQGSDDGTSPATIVTIVLLSLIVLSCGIFGVTYARQKHGFLETMGGFSALQQNKDFELQELRESQLGHSLLLHEDDRTIQTADSEELLVT